jgi:hypothetical protein
MKPCKMEGAMMHCSTTGESCHPESCSRYDASDFPLDRCENGELPDYESDSIMVGRKVIVRNCASEPDVAYYKGGRFVSSKSANHYQLPIVFNENCDMQEVLNEGWLRVSLFQDSCVIEGVEMPSRDTCKSVMRKMYECGAPIKMHVSVHASKIGNSLFKDNFYSAEELL